MINIYKLITIAALILAAILCLYNIQTRRMMAYQEQKYNDFVSLTDAALSKQSALLIPESCAQQLLSSDIIQIKIIR